MQTTTFSPVKLIYLSTPYSIWESLSVDNEIQYFYLGTQSYTLVWELQKQIHAKRVAGEISDVVLFVEHEHVYTFGKNADTNNLLDSKPLNAGVVQIDRGGVCGTHRESC